MLTTELYHGQGLGNQLWCYVVTRVIALDNGYEFGIMHPERFKGAGFLDLDFGNNIPSTDTNERIPPYTLPEGIRFHYSEQKHTHPRTGADIREYDPLLAHIADSTKIDGLMQDEQYIAHRKNEIKTWLTPKENPVATDSDTCVINFRGGEYVRFPEIFLEKNYWKNAISHMRKINPRMRFLVVTDDTSTARSFFPDFEIRHNSIAEDYSTILQATYLILSNSSFAWFPAWLNTNAILVIAPKYWAHHNVSDGYWSTGGAITAGWSYLDRNGNLSDTKTCQKEYLEYKEKNVSLFAKPTIPENFLVVSNYHNDISWVSTYTKNYIVYDQSGSAVYSPYLDPAKIIPSEHRGHNIRDYCTYIIDHYETLPDRILFCAGNVFPRHVSQNRFIEVMNRTQLTPIFEPARHSPRKPISYITQAGLYAERNTSWYLKNHPTKYFPSYTSFLQFCFAEVVVPKYIEFAPGANYVVEKESILKYPKPFYENLRLFVSHTDTAIAGESHIIERALYMMWHDSPKPSVLMRQKITDGFNGVSEPFFQKIERMVLRLYYSVPSILHRSFLRIQYGIQKIPSLLQYFTGKRDLRTLWNRPEMRPIMDLRKKMHTIYRKIQKLNTRMQSLVKDHFWKYRVAFTNASAEDIARFQNFPIIESDALQRKCDYSFGAHSGILGHVPGAFIKKANASNQEFKEAVRNHTGDIMTLFIDNVRLYYRPLPYRDWLRMKPVEPADKAWLDTMADEDLLALCAQFPQKKFIIFTALEDNPLDEKIIGRIPENVLRINAANAVYFGGKIVPYPHGLERCMYWGYNHHRILRTFLADTREATKPLYVNHRNDTGNRGSLYALFSGKSWATVSPRTDYANYLSGIKNHKFVLCPSGNGIESARNWETLYMRRVPVFKRHPCLEELFKDFPALFVDDWSEVTEELLAQNEHLYQKALTMNMDSLNLDILFQQRITL